MVLFDSLQTLSFTDLCVRVLVAIILGGLMGLDRDLKNKPIDFRAYIIVCVSTCLVAILGQELYASYASKPHGNVVTLDMAKIIAGTLTGIGFLGAGAIIKNGENNVVGSATGASIWGSAIIGLCIGFDYLSLAVVGFVAVFGALFIFGMICKPIKGSSDKEKT